VIIPEPSTVLVDVVVEELLVTGGLIVVVVEDV